MKRQAGKDGLTLSLVLLILLAAWSARAERLVLGPVTTPDELQQAGHVLRLVLHSPKELLAAHSGILSAYVDDLSQDEAVAREQLGKASADLGLVGSLASRDGWWEFSGRLIAAEGPTRNIQVFSRPGQVVELADALARAVSSAADVQLKPPSKEFDLGDVHPFARALVHRSNGEPDRAVSALLSGRRAVARQLPGAEALTASVLDQEDLAVQSRLSIAAAFDLFDEADQLMQDLPEKDRAVWSAVFEARKNLVILNLSEAQNALRPVARSDLPEVVLAAAQIAQELEDNPRLKRHLLRIARQSPVHPPAALWLSTLPPNLLEDSLGKQLIRYLEKVRPDFPVIASYLALRAAAIGQSDVLRAEDVYFLSAAEQQQARDILQATTRPLSSAEAAFLANFDALTSTRGEPPGASVKVAEAVRLDTEQTPPDQAARKSLDRYQAIASAATPLLMAFAPLTEMRLVVVVPRSVRAPWWGLRWPVEERFVAGLRLALTSKPFNLKVVEHESALTGPLTRETLSGLASAADADGVLLYEIEARGANLGVHLTLFHRDLADVLVVDDVLAGGELDLVRWNPWMIRGGILVLATLAIWLAYIFIRGAGSLDITVEMHRAQKELLCVAVGRSAASPMIDDTDAFIESLRRKGVRRKRCFASHVGEQISLSRIPAGRKFVHLYGVVEESVGRKVLSLSREVRIRRGKTEKVTFNLVPDKAEYRLHVSGIDGRCEVWLEGHEDQKVFTDERRVATIQVPVGHQTIHLRHQGQEVSVAVHALDTQPRNKAIDFERELRMAALAEGIRIDDVPPADELEIELTSQPTPAIRDASPALAGTHKYFGATPSNSAAASRSASESDSSRSGLARYQPQRELGRGAMGVVMLAKDLVLDRTVALKVMSQELRQNPTASQMFLEEAKALAALNHPNIVTVFDQGNDNGQMYIVMELVEGTTLEDRLGAEKSIPVAESLAITAQLAEALAYAHERRVIHRDIKPANIFLDSHNRAKLGDFGLARVLKEALIRKTTVKGTPLYMSPEQIMGRDIDGRSDIYSLGCTVYEMLAGQPPFVDGDVLFHHMHTEPSPPSVHVASIPPALDALVLRCLAKEKDDRPASGAVVLGQLKAML